MAPPAGIDPTVWQMPCNFRVVEGDGRGEAVIAQLTLIARQLLPVWAIRYGCTLPCNFRVGGVDGEQRVCLLFHISFGCPSMREYGN
jgi:hypothetical protein